MGLRKKRRPQTMPKGLWHDPWVEAQRLKEWQMKLHRDKEAQNAMAFNNYTQTFDYTFDYNTGYSSSGATIQVVPTAFYGQSPIPPEYKVVTAPKEESPMEWLRRRVDEMCAVAREG